MGKHLAVHYSARREDSRVADIGKKIFKAVLSREDIIVHTPYPVSALLIRSVNARVEATASAYIFLMDNVQSLLRVEPFMSAVGGTVIHNDYFRQPFLPAQAFYAMLEQFQPIICYDNCYYFHL
jgi:hypothetical protein